jgi:DNA repair protein RadD
MRVEYKTGWHHYISEWVCPEHTGWARRKFVQWWTERSMMSPPTSAAEAVRLAEDGALAETRQITTRHVSGEKYDHITHHELGLKPEYNPEPGWNDCRDEENDLSPVAAWDNDDDIPF